jgi:hypothetical protein
MQITLEVSPQIQQEAEHRGLSVEAFVQQLLEQAFASLAGQHVLRSAVDRIRSLRHSVTPAHRD